MLFTRYIDKNVKQFLLRQTIDRRRVRTCDLPCVRRAPLPLGQSIQQG